jgi:hypothetical protein
MTDDSAIRSRFHDINSRTLRGEIVRITEPVVMPPGATLQGKGWSSGLHLESPNPRADDDISPLAREMIGGLEEFLAHLKGGGTVADWNPKATP